MVNDIHVVVEAAVDDATAVNAAAESPAAVFVVAVVAFYYSLVVFQVLPACKV
jgi:hypothetical protein